MNVKKLMSKTAIVAVSIGLVAVSAHAGPPRDSGRDVIGDATAICGTIAPAATSDEAIRADACDLLMKSDGNLDLNSRKCEADPDYPDATTGLGLVTYSLRNCAKNEAAQQRAAASVVLSMDDLIERNKYQQSLTAAKSACEYAAKGQFLLLAKKLKFAAGTDLVEDAENIAAALGWDYCADLL